MSLIEQLKKNQLEARKNHEKERLSVLQVVLSVLKNESIAKQKELSDEEVVEVLQKQVKQLNDAMQDFARGGREDLVENNKLLHESDLVKAFVGDRSALQDEIAETQREEFDDTQDIDVLPADSSQKLAIELAKAGTTFVLQGPPGTGKSQTISNIIAALLEKKKKILFVSQKMAALNVVHKRLEEVGLGRYCLNLHNYKGNKKEVIKII